MDVYPKFSKTASPVKSLPIILFVGVLRESKGVEVLLDACCKLRDAGIPYQLKLMGKLHSGAFRTRVGKFIYSNNLTEHVDLLGVVTGDNKWQVYSEADILAFPSFFESEATPRTVLEAMSFEIPVVATRWRGIPSMVEDGESGFLVPIRDSQALANKLAVLLKDQELRRSMGKRGRQIYLERFTVEKFWNNMERAFLSVALDEQHTS